MADNFNDFDHDPVPGSTLRFVYTGPPMTAAVVIGKLTCHHHAQFVPLLEERPFGSARLNPRPAASTDNCVGMLDGYVVEPGKTICVRYVAPGIPVTHATAWPGRGGELDVLVRIQRRHSWYCLECRVSDPRRVQHGTDNRRLVAVLGGIATRLYARRSHCADSILRFGDTRIPAIAVMDAVAAMLASALELPAFRGLPPDVLADACQTRDAVAVGAKLNHVLSARLRIAAFFNITL